MDRLDTLLISIKGLYNKTKTNKIFSIITALLFDWNIGIGLYIRNKKGKAIKRLILFLIALASLLMFHILHGLTGDAKTSFLPITNAGKAFMIFAIVASVFNGLFTLIDIIGLVLNKEFNFRKVIKFNNFASSSNSSDEQMAKEIVNDLGGLKNLENVDACITKLRVSVKDDKKIIADQDHWKKEREALGFIKSGKGIQIAYGARAETLKGIILEFLDNPLKFNAISSNTISSNGGIKVTSNIKTKGKVLMTKPIVGIVKPIIESTDELFAKKSMGDGVIIIPKQGLVKAPFDGTIISTFPTGHAYGLQAEDGTQVLIHIGIDSYKDKTIFKSKVKQGDKVMEGQVIVEFDLVKLKKTAKSIETPFIIMTETIAGRKITISKTSKTVMILS